jgi:hypothetical protein
MPEPTTPVQPQAGETGVTPTQAVTNTSPDALAADGNNDTISLEEARKLRSEAQALRKREKDILAQLKAYQDVEQATKDAQLSEVEKINKQYAELQAQHEELAAQLAESLVRQEVADHVSAFNFVIKASTVANLLLVDFDAIEFTDGKPTNVEKLLEKLAKAEPDLVKVAQEQQKRAPMIPAMSPERASITPSGQQQGRIPRLTDPNLWKT